MAEYVICEKSELTAVADAIRAKTGTNESLKLTEIPNRLDGAKEKGINFYDYDGTLLYTYTVEEFASATNLPPLPTQTGLICQGWNWNLEDIKAMNREVNVGATYITDDGSTRLYIHLEEGYTSPMLGLGVNGTVTIDWGDDSEPDILTGKSTGTIKYTSNHEYGVAGDYIITLTVSDTTKEHVSFSGNNYGSYILRHSSSMDTQNLKYCSFLQKVEIGNNILIGNYAFKHCKNLTSITIPNSVSSMAGNLFQNCYNLTSITIPNSVTMISVYTFNHCHNLTSIAIPNSVTKIGSDIFSYCYNLTSITIPNSVISITGYAFQYCYNLTSIALPDNITSIDSSAFCGCYNLTSITIPNSVTSIGGSAFYNCYNLTSITIPNSVTNIGNSAFYNCYNLTSITIPNSVTSIGNFAFYNCYNLTSITIPNSVISIGNSAFYSCHSLTSITIPNSVTSINTDNIFYNCQNLTSIIIPNSVTSIEKYAFYNCQNLTSIIIPNSVTNIGNSAFFGCYNICFYDFASHTTVPTLSATNAFSSIPTGCEIRVPMALYDEWIAATNWSTYKSYIVGV